MSPQLSRQDVHNWLTAAVDTALPAIREAAQAVKAEVERLYAVEVGAENFVKTKLPVNSDADGELAALISVARTNRAQGGAA